MGLRPKDRNTYFPDEQPALLWRSEGLSVHPTAVGTLNIGTRNVSFRQGAGRKREAGRERVGWKELSTSDSQVKVICKSSLTR